MSGLQAASVQCLPEELAASVQMEPLNNRVALIWPISSNRAEQGCVDTITQRREPNNDFKKLTMPGQNALSDEPSISQKGPIPIAWVV